MSAGPLVIEITSLFIIVLYLLNKYSDLRQQNKITLIGTFIAWYFSFMIVFLLPMDISLVSIFLVFSFKYNFLSNLIFKQTTYRQCEKEHEPINDNSSNPNQSDVIKYCKEQLSLKKRQKKHRQICRFEILQYSHPCFLT